MLKNDQMVYIGLEVVIACLAMAGNVLVCWAVCLNSNLQSVTNLFVVAGFCFHFHACLFISCSLLAIAVDRYIAIKNPLRYGSVVTARRAKYIVALCWIFSLAIGLPPILGWNTGGNTTSSTACPLGMRECSFEGVITMHYMVYFNFFGCVLMPLVAMLVIYAHIFMAARRQLRLICVEVTTASTKSTLQKEIHAAKSLAIIVGLFFNYLCHGCKRSHIWVVNIAIILSHANSAVNPFIYAYRIREFKHTFRRILNQYILGNRERQQTEIRDGNNIFSTRSWARKFKKVDNIRCNIKFHCATWTQS
uniref:Adenosine A2a receptor n=1 Tax=Neogobius melanostomus TaxID=47308 RepID=A0A8C6V1E4_9GOBI